MQKGHQVSVTNIDTFVIDHQSERLGRPAYKALAATTSITDLLNTAVIEILQTIVKGGYGATVAETFTPNDQGERKGPRIDIAQ